LTAWKFHGGRPPKCRQRRNSTAFSDYAEPIGVIAPLDRAIQDRAVEPGDDSVGCVNLTEKRPNIANIDSPPKTDIVHGQANVDRTARLGRAGSESNIDAGTGNAIFNHNDLPALQMTRQREGNP
jgi:hypothetical protein